MSEAIEEPAAEHEPAEAMIEAPPVPVAPEVAPERVALELSIPPSITPRLFRLPSVAALRAGRTRSVATHLVWHDTPDGGLAQDGLSLVETRSPGRSLWQMQIAVRDGTLLWPPGAPAPSLGESDDLATLPGLKPGPLLPLATLQGHRRILPLAESPLAGFEVLEGVLSVGTTERPVARLFLYGTSEVVFELAGTLMEAGLTLPVGSLAGEIRAGLRASSAPAAPVLRPDLSLDDAFAHVVGQLGCALMHHAPGARLGAGPEPVHQMRVALRRLRSALSLFRRAAGSAELDRARADLGALGRALGPARDWDVFLAGIARDVGRLLPAEPAVGRMAGSARRQRANAYKALAAILDGPGFQRTLLDLAHLAIARPWRKTAGQDRPQLVEYAVHALDRRLRRVTEAGDDLSDLPAAELHAVRIQCKRLRYAAEFFSPLTPSRQTRRFLRRLAAVQERLGHLNDGAVAADLLDQLGGRGFAAGVVQGYLAARSAGGRAKAERSWKKFLRAEPFWE